jgi:hypothetical protein
MVPANYDTVIFVISGDVPIQPCGGVSQRMTRRVAKWREV